MLAVSLPGPPPWPLGSVALEPVVGQNQEPIVERATPFKTVPLVTFFVQMAPPLQCLLPPCVPCSCEHTAGLIYPKI